MATIGHQSINVQAGISTSGSGSASYGPVPTGCYALVQVASNSTGSALSVGVNSLPAFQSGTINYVTSIYVGPGSTVSATGTGTIAITGVLFSNS